VFSRLVVELRCAEAKYQSIEKGYGLMVVISSRLVPFLFGLAQTPKRLNL